MKQNKLETELAINDLCKTGEGIGIKNQKKIKVCHAYPGDTVKIELYKNKKRGFYKGRLKDIIKPSSDRTAPTCQHGNICGGCKLGQLSYAVQLQYKEQLLKKTFANFSNVQIFSIIPSDPWTYRNKMEFTFSENRAGTKFLGLMIAGAGKYVFNVTECFLMPGWVSKVLNEIRSLWETSSLQAYNPLINTGILRYLTCREAKNTSQKMVILTILNHGTFSEENEKAFVTAIKKALLKTADVSHDSQHKGQASKLSIILRVQHSQKGQKTYFTEKVLFGPGFLQEELKIAGKKLKFKISADSFFQPNPLQAEKLFEKALELSEIETRKNPIVLDLYAGSAALALVFANFSQKVIAIEENPSSVLDAQENVVFNDFSNIDIRQGDVGKVLDKLKQESKQPLNPDLVIVDPPRAGLDTRALENILNLNPEKIIYISCNIETQQKNILELTKRGYHLKALQPVDQFPQTMHLENIAFLAKN